jgi:hypothetical protein
LRQPEGFSERAAFLDSPANLVRFAPGGKNVAGEPARRLRLRLDRLSFEPCGAPPIAMGCRATVGAVEITNGS